MTYTPDMSDPTHFAQDAIELLALQPITEEALSEARRLLAKAAEAVPYLGEARHCSTFRRNTRSITCPDRLCGRCAQFEAHRPDEH